MKIRLIILMALLICSCKEILKEEKTPALTQSQKYKKAISTFLSKNMDDYTSYKPLEYSKLDSSYSFYENSQTYIHDAKRSKDILAQSQLSNDNFKSSGSTSIKRHIKQLDIFIDSLEFYQIKMKQDKKSFVPKFNGFKITHSYRGKNAFGATVLNNSIFYLDTSLTKVVGLSDGKTN